MRDDHIHNELRSLEKRSIDSLFSQMFSKIGGDQAALRIVGPSGAFSPLDETYVGVLKQLLVNFIPGIPDSLLSSVRDDLIVVSQASISRSQIVSVGQSRIRVGKRYQNNINQLKANYEELLNTEMTPSPYLESDIHFVEAPIKFQETFFAPKSIKGWCRQSLYFSRLCAKMDTMADASGLKSGSIFNSEMETNLLYTSFVSSNGEEMKLITP